MHRQPLVSKLGNSELLLPSWAIDLVDEGMADARAVPRVRWPDIVGVIVGTIDDGVTDSWAVPRVRRPDIIGVISAIDDGVMTDTWAVPWVGRPDAAGGADHGTANLRRGGHGALDHSNAMR